jgi:hypothetical protein
VGEIGMHVICVYVKTSTIHAFLWTLTFSGQLLVYENWCGLFGAFFNGFSYGNIFTDCDESFLQVHRVNLGIVKEHIFSAVLRSLEAIGY